MRIVRVLDMHDYLRNRGVLAPVNMSDARQVLELLHGHPTTKALLRSVRL